MEWKKVSPEMVVCLDEFLSGYPAERRQMFGCPCYFVNGNMTAGVFADSLFLRLSSEDRQEAFAAYDEAAPFEPMQGRPMLEYVVFPESVIGHKEEFQAWVEKCYRYATTLAPKEPKAKSAGGKKNSKSKAGPI